MIGGISLDFVVIVGHFTNKNWDMMGIDTLVCFTVCYGIVDGPFGLIVYAIAPRLRY